MNKEELKNLYAAVIIFVLIINTTMWITVAIHEPIITVEHINKSCEKPIDTSWNMQSYDCVYPADCFKNYSEYLAQFPNSVETQNKCVYLINCKWMYK